MFNLRMAITYDNYDLEVGEIDEMLFITKIKTRRQRKFRTLKEFYREENNIKINQIDSMLEAFGRAEKDIYDMFKEENELIEKLNIDKTKIAELFKIKMIREIEETEFK